VNHGFSARIVLFALIFFRSCKKGTKVLLSAYFLQTADKTWTPTS